MDKVKILKNLIYILSIFLITPVLLDSCASSKPELLISNYKYEYDNQKYQIRSVTSKSPGECFNQLIGKDFTAVDFNQDQIIDRIVRGEVKLNEAQKIYDYGLQKLAQEHKLKVHVTQVSQYTWDDPCCHYEIKSFRNNNSNPFNQFILIENRNTVSSQTLVSVDQNADGTLDVLVKGSATLEELQPKYESIIKKGLEAHKMNKVNGMILVKQEESTF
jgi:hypothetical protein